MDDILVVMDEAGVERAAVFGWQSGATLAALLAATYPDRVSQLVTFHLDPCPLQKPDWPHAYAWNRSEWEDYLGDLRQGWGTREWVQRHLAEFAPNSASSNFENWGLAMFQLSANPATAEAVERLDMETDIRAVLPAIHVPTLLLHRPEAAVTPPEITAYVAAQISGATVVALAGRDESPYPRRHEPDHRRDRGVPHRRAARAKPRPHPFHRPVHRHRRVHPAAGRARRRPLGQSPRPA